MNEAVSQAVETHTPKELARPQYVLKNRSFGWITDRFTISNKCIAIIRMIVII